MQGFNSKLRICCLTNKVSCITCPPDTVVSINMVGILLKICSTYYYLCPCCMAMRVWSADGMDLLPSAVAGNKCHCSLFSSQQQAAVPRSMNGCIVCQSKHVCTRATLLLPDVARRCMKQVQLCSRHAPPEHVMGTVTCVEEFEAVVKEHCASKTTARKAKRRMTCV